MPSQGRPAEFLKRSYLPGHSGKIIELSLLPASKSSVTVNPIQWGKEHWFSTESTLSSEPRTVYMQEALSEDFLNEWMDQWMNGWLISGLCGNTEETRQVKLKRGFPVCSPGAAPPYKAKKAGGPARRPWSGTGKAEPPSAPCGRRSGDNQSSQELLCGLRRFWDVTAASLNHTLLSLAMWPHCWKRWKRNCRNKKSRSEEAMGRSRKERFASEYQLSQSNCQLTGLRKGSAEESQAYPRKAATQTLVFSAMSSISSKTCRGLL